jgi:hypothetical protein
MSDEQLSAAEVANMTAEQIAKARRDGRLDELLAGDDPGRQHEPFTPPVDPADQGARGRTYGSSREWLRSLSPDEVVRLRQEGALDELLRGEQQ